MDSFLTALQAGPARHIVGVDMTNAQLAKARCLGEEDGFGGVEFREGSTERRSRIAGVRLVEVRNGELSSLGPPGVAWNSSAGGSLA